MQMRNSFWNTVLYFVPFHVTYYSYTVSVGNMWVCEDIMMTKACCKEHGSLHGWGSPWHIRGFGHEAIGITATTYAWKSLSVPKPLTICSPTAWTGSFITPVQTAAASWAIVMLLMIISHYSLFSIYIWIWLSVQKLGWFSWNMKLQDTHIDQFHKVVYNPETKHGHLLYTVCTYVSPSHQNVNKNFPIHIASIIISMV